MTPTTEAYAADVETENVHHIARQIARLGGRDRERLTNALMEEEKRRHYANEVKAQPIAGAGASIGYQTQGPRPGSEELSLDNIEDAMRYQPWDHFQQDRGDQVRDALTAAAKVILRTCPPGRFRSVTLRNIIDAHMNANASISFNGRF
jgi:hypothetical protein